MINDNWLVRISNSDIEKLKWLAANWFTLKGDKPLPIEEALHKIISSQWRLSHPKEEDQHSFLKNNEIK